jgi:dephospho-CoA kinase
VVPRGRVLVRVGLTGGIGAGKSEVARRLAALGAVIIDADVAARAVVEPGTQGHARVVAAFGEQVLRRDGSVDRQALAAIVFADPARRAELNAIVHPLVGAWMAAADEEAHARGGPQAVVVHDVPLLAENNLAGMYDKVIVVDASPQTQLDRLVRDRGMAPAEAQARLAAQATREQRMAIADVVVDNSGSLEELDQQVAKAWAELHQ